MALDIVHVVSLSLSEAYQDRLLSVAQPLGKFFLDRKQFGRKGPIGNASTQALQLCPVGSVCPSIPASSPGKGQSLTSAWIPVHWPLPDWATHRSPVGLTGVEGLSSRGRVPMPLDVGIWDSEGCSSPTSGEQTEAGGQSQEVGGCCGHVSSQQPKCPE